jgi:hypothetical protein
MFLTIPSMVGSEPVKVNIRQLGIVREVHMPAHAVRFAPAEELHRVADEVARQEPELREEVDFVKYEELRRRELLARSPLQVVKGNQYHD